MNDVDTVGGYSVPVDPMDDLQCEKLPVYFHYWHPVPELRSPG